MQIRNFFRRETLYHWNDNWTPFQHYQLAVTVPDLPTFICDDHHYYQLSSFSADIKFTAGIRNLREIELVLYRGGLRIVKTPLQFQTVSNRTYKIYMAPGLDSFLTAWNPLTNTVGMPDCYYMLPGDELVLESSGFINADSITDVTFNLKRWRL